MHLKKYYFFAILCFIVAGKAICSLALRSFFHENFSFFDSFCVFTFYILAVCCGTYLQIKALKNNMKVLVYKGINHYLQKKGGNALGTNCLLLLHNSSVIIGWVW